MSDAKLRQRLMSSAFSGAELELIILPTEQCNFRCTYCYEDFQIGKMQRNIVQAIKALIVERASGLRRLKLNWFGGEPLLARAVILEIMDHASNICSGNEVELFSEMTTNGYLLSPPVASALVRSGVTNYQISIDGGESYHNRTRVRKDGAETFQRIWRNLTLLKEMDLNFHVTLRLHITPENVSSIQDVLAEIRSDFLVDNRFSLFVKEIGDYGGRNTGHIKTLSSDSAAEIKRQVYGYAANEAETISAPYVCYAAKANSFVIRANGDINKCTVALASPLNHVGNLNDDGSISILKNKINPWLSGFYEFDLDRISCPASVVLTQARSAIIPTVIIEEY